MFYSRTVKIIDFIINIRDEFYKWALRFRCLKRRHGRGVDFRSKKNLWYLSNYKNSDCKERWAKFESIKKYKNSEKY